MPALAGVGSKVHWQLRESLRVLGLRLVDAFVGFGINRVFVEVSFETLSQQKAVQRVRQKAV